MREVVLLGCQAADDTGKMAKRDVSNSGTGEILENGLPSHSRIKGLGDPRLGGEIHQLI